MKTVCIIVTYNDENMTIAHLKRICGYACFDRILVVDNASSSASKIRLLSYIKHEESGKIELIERALNGGYGAGNNTGLARAQELGAKYALIANPDAEYSEDTISQLLSVMEEHRELAVAAPVMIMSEASGLQKKPGSYPNTIMAPAAWPLRSWWKELLEMGPISRRLFNRMLHYPEEHYLGRSSKGIPDKTVREIKRETGKPVCVYVDAVPGSLLLTDVDKVRRVGGYDEEMFLYGEETLLAHRLKKAGYRTALCLTASYVHRHRAAEPSMKSQLEREKSMKHYMRRYLGAGDMKIKIADILFSVIHAEMKLRQKVTGKAAVKLQKGWSVKPRR